MRVLVDTSVWSLALRRKPTADHPSVAKLRSFLLDGEDLFVTGVILQEVLQAFRADDAFRAIARHLEHFPLLDLDRRDYVAAAALHRACAAKGVSVSTIDCQIAVAAVRHQCHLLTADRDFERIAAQSPLKLV